MTIDITAIVFIVLLGFLLQLLLHLYLNPLSLVHSPTVDRAGEMAETRGSRAMAIFAVVLVVINFLHSPQNGGIGQSTAMPLVILSSGFLMVAFMLETYGTINNFIFKLQEDCLNYAGLLLFSSLYFVVSFVSPETFLRWLVLAFVLLAWGIWIVYKLDYLFVVQTREWEAVEADRRDLVKAVAQRILGLF